MEYKRLLRRTCAPVAVAAAVLGSGLVLAPSANADAADCPEGNVCIWEHSEFSGRMYARTALVNNPRIVDQFLDNRASSVNTRHTIPICFYSGPNYTGELLFDTKQNNYPRPTLPAGTNDRISSWKKC